MIGNNVRYWIALGTGLLLYVGQGAAWAQTAADKASADALFDKGQKLIRKPNDTAAWATACELFDASVKKFTQLGAQIALANCYEKIGKTASALGAFRAALSTATKIHDSRQQRIEQDITALEAKLSKIVIRLETINRVTGLTVKCDGVEITPAEFGSAVPIDPGEHVVEASAPGRIAWSTRMSIPSTPGIVEIPIPILEKVPHLDNSQRIRRISSYIIGSGIAAVGVSAIFGTVAYVKWNTAEKNHCYDADRCDPRGLKLAHDARTWGHMSTGTFLFGAGAAAAGTIIWLTARSVGSGEMRPANATAPHLIPNVGPAQVGLTIHGEF